MKNLAGGPGRTRTPEGKWVHRQSRYQQMYQQPPFGLLPLSADNQFEVCDAPGAVLGIAPGTGPSRVRGQSLLPGLMLRPGTDPWRTFRGSVSHSAPADGQASVTRDFHADPSGAHLAIGNPGHIVEVAGRMPLDFEIILI